MLRRVLLVSFISVSLNWKSALCSVFLDEVSPVAVSWCICQEPVMAAACRLHTSVLLSHEVQESMGIVWRLQLIIPGWSCATRCCATVAGVTRLFVGALKAHYMAEGYSRSKKVQHKRTLSTLPLRFFGGIRLLDFCCECDLSQCVSFLVKHCVARKPLSFSRVALVCGVAERVHLVQQGYCADSVTRLFSESFRLIV